MLMDGSAIVRTGADGKAMRDRSYLNQFPQAMVVPNPAIPRGPQAGTAAIDPFIVRLNEGRPYNLLMAKKGWTLAVKSYAAPVQIQSKDDEPAMARRIGFSSGADVLAAGAGQAEQLAKALREMKGPGGQPLHLEAFVLHTRSASLVTVGQFDGPDDPALVEMRRRLQAMSFMSSKDGPAGAMNPKAEPFIGPNFVPTPVPKP